MARGGWWVLCPSGTAHGPCPRGRVDRIPYIPVAAAGTNIHVGSKLPDGHSPLDVRRKMRRWPKPLSVPIPLDHSRTFLGSNHVKMSRTEVVAFEVADELLTPLPSPALPARCFEPRIRRRGMEEESVAGCATGLCLESRISRAGGKVGVPGSSPTLVTMPPFVSRASRCTFAVPTRMRGGRGTR